MPLSVEKRLRKEARVRAAHNSTWIENRTLSLDEARRVIEDKAELDPSRATKAAAAELRNYWAALSFIDHAVIEPFSEDLIRRLHAVIYGGTRGPGRPPEATPYRKRHLQVGRFEYLPPEPQDVPALMEALVAWIRGNEQTLPGPIVAAVAAYQLVTIHPFDDGNGRSCRALATLMLARTGYGLKGLASMESFYADDVARYYDALQMGLHPNYYETNARGSRSDPDLTPWISYFTDMFSRAAAQLRSTVEMEAQDRASLLGANPLEALPRPVRRILGELPDLDSSLTPADVSAWFGVSTKTARDWLARWCREGHFEAARPGAERIRRYRVSAKLRKALQDAGVA